MICKFMQLRNSREMSSDNVMLDGKEAAPRSYIARHFQFNVCFSKGSTPVLRKHSTGHVATPAIPRYWVAASETVELRYPGSQNIFDHPDVPFFAI